MHQASAEIPRLIPGFDWIQLKNHLF